MKKYFNSLFFIFFIHCNLYSQDGIIDPTFNTTDIGNYFGDGVDNYIRAACKQSDGKIIVGGDNFSELPYKRMMRCNLDGSFDETFNVGNGPDGTITTIDIQADGKILVGGLLNSFNGQSRYGIARLNTDGSLDSTFNPNLNGYVLELKILNDGKILIGGSFTSVNGVGRNYLAKLNNDGSLDATFDIGTGFNNNISCIKEQADQKLIIGGAFTNFNGSTQNRIIRLNADGSKDNTFIIGNGFNSSVLEIDLQNDKIIAVGNFTTYNSINSNKIARLNNNGNFDNSFTIGTGFNNSCLTVKVLNDNKIVVGGNFTNFNNVERNLIAKLNEDGTLDSSFNLGSIAVELSIQIPFYVNTIILLNSNEFFVGGNTPHFNYVYRNGMMICQNNGNITSFNDGTGINGNVSYMLNSNDGKYFVFGRFNKFNGLTNKNLVKINNNGTIDSSFNTGLGTSNTVLTADIQNDNKIIIGGYFTKFNSLTKNYITRINPDGSIDNSFNIGNGFNNYVTKLKILSDGKILVLGQFTSYNGTNVNKLIKLNTDGTIDTSFNIGPINGSIITFEIDLNNKILIGGYFSNLNGTPVNSLVRLNQDGSIDTSLQILYQTNNLIKQINVQNDGKIILTGDFTTFNNITANSIIRINDDGTTDTSFNTGNGFFYPTGASISFTKILPDNKILICGNFDSYNSTPIINFLRLNNDGSLDTTFNSGFELANNRIATFLLDGVKLLIGGGFVKYNNIGKNRIARLNIDSLLSYKNNNIFDFKLFPNPTSDSIQISLQENLRLEKVNIYNALGQLLVTENSNNITISSLMQGTYFVEVITDQGKATKSIIKN